MLLDAKGILNTETEMTHYLRFQQITPIDFRHEQKTYNHNELLESFLAAFFYRFYGSHPVVHHHQFQTRKVNLPNLGPGPETMLIIPKKHEQII